MTITLDNIIPAFLEKEKIDSSGIWNNRVVFNQGEQIHIVASSGRGKTSFMHFLYGLRNEYTGNILLDTKKIQTMNAVELAETRRSVNSIIFQNLRLFTANTVFDNINIKRLLNPFHGAERIQEMASRLGIENKLYKPVSTCSYGEQQRVAIIRALQQPFQFLLMDEPFSNLDETNRKIAMELIQEEVIKRKAGIILADLKPIEYFNADRVLYL